MITLKSFLIFFQNHFEANMQKTILLIFASVILGVFSFNTPTDQTLFATPGTLFALANVSLQLGTIDPQSGKITPFGPGYDEEIVSFQLTAIDYINQLFYAVNSIQS
jgi:hypothetical protein